MPAEMPLQLDGALGDHEAPAAGQARSVTPEPSMYPATAPDDRYQRAIAAYAAFADDDDDDY